MSIREDVLDTAKEIVCNDRNNQYGEPEDNFGLIAKLWSCYTSTNLSSKDVANMMILFKVARNATGNSKVDNWVDIAGYAACGAECDGFEAEAKAD